MTKMMKKVQKQSSFLNVGNGHNLFIEEFGDPQGDPLLLIHGGSGYVFQDDDLAFLEDTNRRIIVYHQRGMGSSLPYGETAHNSVQDNINDIERIRAHLGIESWDVMSWSFGAVFGGAYTLSHPEHTKSFTAYAPYFGAPQDYDAINKDPKSAAQYHSFHGTNAAKGIVKSIFNKASQGDYDTKLQAYWNAVAFFDDNPPSIEELEQTKTKNEWEDFFNVRLIHAAQDLELYTSHENLLEDIASQNAEAIAKQSVPVTLIYGEDDLWSAPNSDALSLFPAHKRIEIPGASHMIDNGDVQHTLKTLLSTSAPVFDRKSQFRP